MLFIIIIKTKTKKKKTKFKTYTEKFSARHFIKQLEGMSKPLRTWALFQRSMETLTA